MKTINHFPALFFAIIPLCYSSPDVKGGDVEGRFGGIESTAIMAAPSSVKAWRTAGSLQPDSASPGDYYQKFGEAVLVATNLAQRLSKVLLAEKSYYPRSDGVAKACHPDPGIVITFFNGKEDIDVFFCFECNILEAVRTAKGEKAMPGLRSDFDPSRAKLLRIMKQIFPKDLRIQSLKRNA
jgi:hypothetical protein